jgi:hypothetical protein
MLAAWERFDAVDIFLSGGKAITRRAMSMSTTMMASFSDELFSNQGAAGRLESAAKSGKDT